MRQRFFPKLLIILLCLILCITVSVQAQNTYIPITSNNVAQISQVERIGNGKVTAQMFSPDGSHLAIATALGVYLIGVDKTGKTDCIPADNSCHLLNGQGGADSIAFSADGSMIAIGGEDNSVTIFAPATGEVITRLENHLYPISAVAWSDDGKWLASGDWSGLVRLWDTSNWSESHVYTPSGSVVEALEIDTKAMHLIVNYSTYAYTLDIKTENVLSTSSSSYFLQGNTTGNLKIFNSTVLLNQIEIVNKDTVVTRLDGFYGELGGVFFTADGRVGASPLKSPYLWSLDGQPSSAPPPVLSPDGSRLATFGNDGVIHLKDAKTQTEIAALHGHIRAVTDVAFSPDGKLLVSSSNDGTIQLWDATVMQDSGSVAALKGHNGGVSSVAFNADGTLIASSGYDGTIRLWGIKS